MRRDGSFHPHLRALGNAEAVLLVDDGQAEAAEHHLVLKQCVGADEHLQRAVAKSLVDAATLLRRRASRQQLALKAQTAAPLRECLEMLCGEYLRGSHKGRLETVVGGDEHRHERHHGLAAPYVPLHEAVHLAPRAQVVAYFVHHALLGIRQLEGYHVAVERVEEGADLREDVSGNGGRAATRIAQYL